MTERAQAAQRLWRELIQACTTAAAGGLDTDDLGYVVLELGLALLALDFTPEELVGYVTSVRNDLEGSRLAAVNAALRARGQDFECADAAWSWVNALSGFREAHPRWAERQLLALAELLAFTPSRKFGIHS